MDMTKLVVKQQQQQQQQQQQGNAFLLHNAKIFTNKNIQTNRNHFINLRLTKLFFVTRLTNWGLLQPPGFFFDNEPI